MKIRHKRLYAWVFGRPLFSRLNKCLFDLSIKGLGILNHQSLRMSGEAFFVKRLLPKFILDNNHPIMVDVGANIGYYSLLLSIAFPNAKIYSIEPHPLNFERLKKSCLENMHCCLLGLSDTSGKALLYDIDDHGGGSPYKSRTTR